VKSALIGYGYWGTNIARAISQSDELSLEVICDSNSLALEKARKIYPQCRLIADFRDISDDIEIVAIISPTSSHFYLAEHFLKAGKHVLVSKPLAKSLDQAEHLSQLAKEVNRTLFVDHTFVFNPAVRELKHLLPKIGRPYFVLSQRLNLGLYQPDINVIYDLMPHDLSILAYLFETEIFPLHVNAIAAAGLPQEDLAHCHFVTALGFEGLITVSWLSPSKIREFTIVGSNGMLVYNDVEVAEKIKYYDRGIEVSDLADQSSLPVYTSRISYRSGDLYSPAIPNVEALTLELSEFHKAIFNDEVRSAYHRVNLRTMAALDRIIKMTIKK
jgi:predicted dehydrogenase